MDDLRWGLEMTLLGMGTVFLLLALLMGLLVLVGRLDRAAAPAPVGPAPAEPTAPAEVAEPAAPVVRVLAGGLTEDELAAVTAAVLTHREARRREAAPEQRASAPGSRLFASRWVGIGRGQQTQSWRRK